MPSCELFLVVLVSLLGSRLRTGRSNPLLCSVHSQPRLCVDRGKSWVRKWLWQIRTHREIPSLGPTSDPAPGVLPQPLLHQFCSSRTTEMT